MKITIIAIVSTFFLIWMIQNPFIGIYLFTVLLNIKPVFISPALASSHMTRIVAILTILLFFLQYSKNRNFNIMASTQSKLMIALTFTMGMSVITSIWHSNSIESFLNFIKITVAFFLIISSLNSLQRHRAIVWALILPSVFISIVSIRVYYQSGAAASHERMFGAFGGALLGDPNDFALGLIMLIPFLYYDLFRKRNLLRKAIQILIIVIFLFAIALTQSRGGFIGLLTILFTIWIQSKKKILAILILIVVSILGWSLTPDSYKERILSIRTASSEDAAAISREDAWKAGINMMAHQLFGVGIGNFGEGFVTYRLPGAIDLSGTRRAPHNMLIQIGGEGGVPSLIIFIMLILTSFRALSLIKRKTLAIKNDVDNQLAEMTLFIKSTFVSLVGFCVGGMFLSQSYNFCFYYLIAFSVTLNNLLIQDYKNKK